MRIVNTVPNVYVALVSLLAVGGGRRAVATALPTAAVALPWCACALLGYLPTVYLARLFPFHDVGVAAYWAFLVVVLDRARRAVPRASRAAVTSTR